MSTLTGKNLEFDLFTNIINESINRLLCKYFNYDLSNDKNKNEILKDILRKNLNIIIIKKNDGIDENFYFSSLRI